MAGCHEPHPGGEGVHGAGPAGEGGLHDEEREVPDPSSLGASCQPQSSSAHHWAGGAGLRLGLDGLELGNGRFCPCCMNT